MDEDRPTAPAARPRPVPAAVAAGSWRRLAGNEAFVFLFLSVLSSAAASFVLLLALAAAVLEATGSATLTAAIYVSQWLAPLAFAPVIGAAVARLPTRPLLAGIEAASAGLALVIGIAGVGALPLLYALLVVRGGSEGATRSARYLAYERFLPPALLERANALLTMGLPLGGAQGGLIGAGLVERVGLETIGATAAVLALLAAALAAAARPDRPEAQAKAAGTPADGAPGTARPSGGLPAALRVLAADPPLARALSIPSSRPGCSRATTTWPAR